MHLFSFQATLKSKRKINFVSVLWRKFRTFKSETNANRKKKFCNNQKTTFIKSFGQFVASLNLPFFSKCKSTEAMLNFIDKVLPVNAHRSRNDQKLDGGEYSNLKCDCCPSSRSGHRMFATEDFVYLVGGYDLSVSASGTFDDTWRFDLATEKWEELVASCGSMPRCLASFSLVQTNVEGEILIFGGTGYPFGHNATNELFRAQYDHYGVKLQIRRMNIVGDHLPKIYGHAMAYRRQYDCTINTYAEVVYLVGGTTGHVYYIDVWKLQSDDRNNWKCQHLTKNLAEEEELQGRYRLELVATENRLITFGGGNSSFCAKLDNLLVFDLCQARYETITTIADPKHGFPLARKCHAVVEFDNYVYIVGGFHESFQEENSQFILNDIWCMNLETFAWRKLDSKLYIPVFFHSAAVTQEGCLYIFGGCTDPETKVRTKCLQRMWLRPPSLRYFAARALYNAKSEETT